MGQQGPLGAQKNDFFSKMILDHMENQNKCFWCILSPWWPVVALLKSQNALKGGGFATKNGSKMAEKCVSPKVILDLLGCLNKCKEPILSPLQALLAPPKTEMGFQIGFFATKNGSKMGQKCVFPTMTVDHLGCLDK